MSQIKLDLHNVHLELMRFPKTRDASLRAWDAADEYLINYVADNFKNNQLNKLVIINDGFGSLTCAFSTLFPECRISVFTDSYMSKLAIQNKWPMDNQEQTVFAGRTQSTYCT